MTDAQIREKLQAYIVRLIDRGTPAAVVIEELVTVAATNLATLHGPRRASRALLSVGAGLKVLADQAENDQGSNARH